MNKEELEEFIKEHSTREAARHFNCSQTNIRYWMQKFDIKKPKDWREGYARIYTEEDKKVLSEAMKNSEKHKQYSESVREAYRINKEKEMDKIKICKKCGKEFKMTKGLINFCSLKCRNTKEVSEETKKKISEGVKNSEKALKCLEALHENYRKRLREMKISSNVENEEYFKLKKERHIKYFMEQEFNKLGETARRERIMHEQNYKCFRCELSKWQGEPLVLEIEHIDGDHHNNERNNLIMLCPNCHSLTKTWRGRNINKANVQKTTDEVLIEELIKTNFNFTQALKNLGMSGAKNHVRCKKLMSFYVGIKEKLENDKKLEQEQ